MGRSQVGFPTGTALKKVKSVINFFNKNFKINEHNFFEVVYKQKMSKARTLTFLQKNFRDVLFIVKSIL